MTKGRTRTQTGIPGKFWGQKLMRRCMVLLLILTCLATMGSFFAAPGAVQAATPPTLTGYDVTPTTAIIGNAVTLSFTINNPDPVNQDVGLGASIKNNSTDWISDASGDIVVSATPGTATYTRSFRLPANLAVGL